MRKFSMSKWLVTSFIMVTMIVNGIQSSAETLTTPSGIPLDGLESYMDDFAKEHIGSETAGAAVAVIKDNQVIVRKDYGFADIQNQVVVDRETVFEWGSASKILVYISIMQLVEEGKLSLDEDIRTYLPDGFLKKLQYDDKITILNLMHHNAGWSDNIRDMMFDDFDKINPLDEQLGIYEPKQIFHVGEGVGYSNFGIGLAGYIVERVSGVPYYEYVQTHILDPLDMNHTNVYYDATNTNQIDEKRELIKGYTAGLKEAERLYVGIYPAGSVIGTLDDMVKLVMEINPQSTDNKLFKNEDTLTAFLSNSYSVGEGLAGFSHGLFEERYAVDVVGHAGHTNAFSAEVALSPESGYAYLVLSNQNHEQAMSVELEGLIFGNQEIVQDVSNLPDAKEVVGYYKDYRSMFTGFEKWLSSPIKVSYIDETHIEYNHFIAEQVRPYTYVYVDDNGITQTLYFEKEGQEIKKMALISNSELFPVNAISYFAGTAIMILTGLLILYFLLLLIVELIRLIKNKGFKGRLNLYRFLLCLGSLGSIVNTLYMFVMIGSFTSQKALSIHFAYNMIYIGFVLALIVLSMRKQETLTGKKRTSIVLSYTMAIIWSLMIVLCQFYR